MFHHMVMFRFKDGTDSRQIDEITEGLGTLPPQIGGLVAYRFGSDVGITEGSWDYGVAADFAVEAHYDDYRDHPAHVRVVEDRIKPVLDDVARVQFRS
jgi:hypothetical protein